MFYHKQFVRLVYSVVTFGLKFVVNFVINVSTMTHCTQVKLALDDEVSQRNTELAQVKLEVDRKTEENRKLQDELVAVKKVCYTRVAGL